MIEAAEEHFSPRELALFLSGQRGQEAEARVHGHLVTCASCKAAVERLEWLLAVVRSNSPEREQPFPPDTRELWGELHAWLWPAADLPMQAARILELEAELAEARRELRDLFVLAGAAEAA